MCNDVVALRRGDQHAFRLDLERERLDFDKEQLRELRDEEFRDWAQKHRDEICKGYKTQEERITMLRKAMFGDLIDTLEPRGEVEPPDCQSPDQANSIQPDPTESNQFKP